MNTKLKRSVYLPLIALAIIGSCSKKETAQRGGPEPNNQTLSVEEARTWFNAKHAEDRKIMSNLTANSQRRMTTYSIGAFAGDPEWKNTRTDNATQGLRIELDNTSGWGGKNSFRDLIILKDQNGNIKEYIQEVIFDSVYLRQLLRMHRSTEGIRSYSYPATFTGKVMFYTTSNLFIKGAIFKDGAQTGALAIKGGSTNSSPTNVLAKYRRIGVDADTVELPPVVIVTPPVGGGEDPPMPPDPPNPPGNGGGTPTNPTNPTDPGNPTTDPCSAGSSAAAALTAIFNESAMQQTKANLGDIKNLTLEKGYALYERVSVDSFDNTKIKHEYYYAGAIQTGTDSSIVINTTTSYLEGVVTTVHTHPAKGLAGPSPADIYQLIQNVYDDSGKFTGGRYQGNFVLASDGTMYGITVTNMGSAFTFKPSQVANLNGSAFNTSSLIGKAYDEAYQYFLANDYKKNKDQKNLAHADALAYVLSEFHTGVAITKYDPNTKSFKPIVKKKVKTTDSKGNVKTTFENGC
ncbi:hypothetical protein [Niabella beijingensis]|uniref:hypothetical protein n=1 Tax=Niabella beijingensis TaxID=2872700 RepID=UPI001CBA85A2|nr:hypothetical protein [Niabella beijingensis]MBZ4191930.1 hypothetical protein [Niabella beijingensis]